MRSDKAVRVDVDWTRLERELLANVSVAQEVLDYQVLKDSQPYVPRDTGNLVLSGITATQPGSGEVRWGAPYAAAQYYGRPNKAKDVHPKATMQWFEAAKAACKTRWLAVVKKIGGARR